MVATADRGLHVKAKTSVSVENPMLFRCPPHQFAPTIPSLSMVVVVEGEGEESSAFSFSSCFASQLFVFNRTPHPSSFPFSPPRGLAFCNGCLKPITLFLHYIAHYLL